MDDLEIITPFKTAKLYTNLKLIYTIFGRKYYAVPLQLINDNIILNDIQDNKINYDIRTVKIEPFNIEIKTFFNENNLNILTSSINKYLSVYSPKYEHYIDYSKCDNIYITCTETSNPHSINCDEINLNKKLVQND